jgi:cytochrome c oxidase subunit II
MILQSTILPEQASELAWHIDNLIWFITIVTGLAGLGVYVAMLVFCIMYRRKTPNELGPAPTPRILGSHKLELVWSVVPLLLFLAMYFWGAWVYSITLHPPDDAPEIYVVGKQWMWKIQYPGGQRVILGQNSLEYSKDIGGEGYFEGVMVLPIGRPVKIVVTSEDVIHDFGVPAFRQKIDAVPGRYTTTWYQPNKLGTYDIFCDQYCGTNHSLMIGKIMVVEPAEYEAWLEGRWKTGPSKNSLDGSLAHQGRQLFQKLNCIQCHDPAKGKAPVLEEIYMKVRPLKGGGNVIADDNYLRESIRRPRAKIRDGWEPIMPAFGPDKASEEDLIKVIAYIKSLKKGETPVRTEDWVAPVGAPTEPPPASKTTEGGVPK